MEKKTEKPGRKARYTRMVLQDSVTELLRTRPITRISIKEICDLADIGRTTFYAHYDDQYDLLQQIEEQTFIDIDKIIQSFMRSAKKSSIREVTVFIQEILQYIANNGNSIQVLLSENGDSGFQRKFFRLGIESIRQATEAAGVTSQKVKTGKYGSVFVVGGTLTLVQEWLKNGMDTPVPELAKILAKLTEDALG
ncbi:MAG: TetR family transcriptional regulator C-terminal domain-containing protein [Treponema sp.]|nr:TetR family transcriptional regulator C-terminal domain-containing protein [Treponema sp.]